MHWAIDERLCFEAHRTTICPAIIEKCKDMDHFTVAQIELVGSLRLVICYYAYFAARMYKLLGMAILEEERLALGTNACICP